MPALLNVKQEKFVQEIFKGTPGAKAYRAAGYKPSTEMIASISASQLLNSAKVQTRLQELQGKVAEKTGITIERVLAELAKIGFANMGDYFRVGHDGDPVVDFSKLTDEQKAAIQEITVEDFYEGRGEDARQVRRVKFKLHDKKGALVDIGKHLGMFKEKVEISGPNGGPIETANLHMTPAQAQEAYANLLRDVTPKK